MINKAKRLHPIDALRGLMMVIMALDHTSYFVAQNHPPGEQWGGEFPVYHDAFAFLTRLVTHPAAPGFAFLMGVGMYLFAHSRREQGWSEWGIIRHFLIRGGFLIAIQLLIINRAWQLGLDAFPKFYIGVLTALGGGMILGSFLLRLKSTYLLVLTCVLFIGTELSHPDPSQWGLIFDQPLGLLFGYSGGDLVLWSNYPILSWLELVTFGIFFGHWVVEDSGRSFKRAIWLGGVFLFAFVIIRYLDGFGNIRPRMGDSWIDFLNVVKYPPSMTFTLMTMGVNLIVLGLFARATETAQRILQPLVVFGRTPLFFYILHLFIYLWMGRWLAPYGTSIPAMYTYWLLGLLIVFPLTLWYGVFKQGQPANSLLRFL
ncbi:MAG TPA: DUF1624 domain-containing protein [Anaerolineae bacterium]|nr:DUF1624 domain-containing protein [Anaerolineae bacterium]